VSRPRRPAECPPATPGKIPARRRQRGEPAGAERSRPGHAARGASGQCRGSGAAAGDRPLRLLVGRTRAMSEEEHRRLVGALAELLADWLVAHPERRPGALRSTPGSGLVQGPRAQEQP
jgi:hypothetical protein